MPGTAMTDHAITPQADCGVWSWAGMESTGHASDYPLQATCAGCHGRIIRRRVGEKWDHRAPDEEITEPAPIPGD